MLKLYIMDISGLPDPLNKSELMESVSKERRLRIIKMKDSTKRRQSLGAGILLGQVLRIYEKDIDDIQIAEHGKPEIEGLYFNLSHSADLVICAVSDKPVGCDIEKIKKAPVGIPERFWGTHEIQHLNTFVGQAYDKEFFRLWTIRESYVKMTGEGLGIPKESLEIVVGEEIEIFRNGERQTCHISEIMIQDYSISICAEESAPVEICQEAVI